MYDFIKCRCHGVKFTRMKALAADKGIDSVGDLQREVRFGDNCKRCVPFVAKMLKTGETEFKVVEANTFEDVPDGEARSEVQNETFGDEDEL